MAKKKEEWRKFVEILVRVGAPYDMVRRFEVLTRPFFENIKRGFWPLQNSWRCDAFFAAAVISRLTGTRVDTIRFVGPDESITYRIGFAIDDYLHGVYQNRLMELLDDTVLVMLSRGITRRILGAIAAHCPEGERVSGHYTVLYLALAAAAGDRELFDALGSVAVAMQDMVPLGQDLNDSSVWYVRAG
jgi:hypothetical protein